MAFFRIQIIGLNVLGYPQKKGYYQLKIFDYVLNRLSAEEHNKNIKVYDTISCDNLKAEVQ